jgi:membrane protein YqaA with SNARE-associated domain
MGMKDLRLWFVAAALWGIAEATFFFIVPDILLTAAVLVFGFAMALRFAVAAAAAAALGGLIMMQWGASDPEAARALLLSVPLIGPDLLDRVDAEIAGAWPVNLTLGAVTGAPYKIYAVEAGAASINPALFAVASIIARISRFALAIGLAWAGFALGRRLGLERWNGAGLAAIWALIYGSYVYIRMNAG